MTILKADLLTPANFITMCGLLVTTYGAIRLDTLVGFIIVIFGKFLDVLDGPVARRTHASDLGAVMDATADKITGLIILTSALYFDLAPLWFILFLFSQHIIVAMLSVYAAIRGIAIKVTQLGKNNMFFHLFTLFLFIDSHFVANSVSRFVWNIGLVATLVSVVTGMATTVSYFRLVFQTKTNSR